MEIRPAVESDVPALMPLMRGYCDFYKANPSDAGLDEMARALIATEDDQGMLLVADEGGEAIGFAAVVGSGRAFAAPGSRCSRTCSSRRRPAGRALRTR